MNIIQFKILIFWESKGRLYRLNKFVRCVDRADSISVKHTRCSYGNTGLV